ncbi:MAG TPA: hypothetical protein VGU43_03720 [Thermoplasmata archaeon]|nr:hypothetical protein [Thermoplasmata archaeon]
MSRVPRHHLESELVAPVTRFFEKRGYRCYRAPDGQDYLDLVARKGGEIGLVELKLSAAATVMTQALRRRGWGDWVAVALEGRRAAVRALDSPGGEYRKRVGILAVEGSFVEELRPYRPIHNPGEPHPFPELKRRLMELLDALDSGTLPPGVGWGALWPAWAGGRRAGREWRLDELDEGLAPSS